jgi:hypothetical protein
VSVYAALLDMLGTPELTVPVSLGAASARGFYDEAGELVPAGSTQLQQIGPVLYLAKDSLAGLAENVSVVVGALGAASALGGRTFKVHQIDPMQDGLVLGCRIGGGR